MSAAVAITYLLSVAVGITIGVFGGGGAILMVPILSYVTGLDTESAVTASLFIVGATSLFSTFLHARPVDSAKQSNVRWGLGAIFGVVAMAGAFIGGQLTPLVPSVVVMTIFAVMMIGSGIGMICDCRGYGARGAFNEVSPVWRCGRILITALAIGVLSGLVGAGGGFLIVPALTLLIGFSAPVAVGTSLLVVAMQSASGFASHLLSTPVEWFLILILTCLAMAGTIIGSAIAKKLPAESLKRAFGVFVLVMAAVVLFEEYVFPG